MRKRFYVYDLYEEERISQYFDNIDDAEQELMIVAGLHSIEDVQEYLQSRTCKYEIRVEGE